MFGDEQGPCPHCKKDLTDIFLNQSDRKCPFCKKLLPAYGPQKVPCGYYMTKEMKRTQAMKSIEDEMVKEGML